MWSRSGGNVLRTLRLASGISILSFGMIPGTLPEPLKIGKTGQRARSYLDRDPSHLLAFEMRWSTRRSLTHSSWHTLLTGNSFGMRTDEEMRRLEAMGTYTDDEINRLARGGKQRGHIAGVGRVLLAWATASPSTPAHDSTLNSLHKMVDFMMSIFKSDSKYSDMFSQFESGGASESGGYEDEEEGADHQDNEDDDGDGDTQRTMEQLQQELAKLTETIMAMNTKIQALENQDHAGRMNANGEPKPYLKLFFPWFSGKDPQGWVYQAEQYFKFQKVVEGDRIALASFHLDGIALQWHRWYTKAQGPVTWAEYTKALLVPFGPTDYEDPSSAQTIHHGGHLPRDFERLSNRVEGLPESFLVGCFIGGLKDEIRLEVKLKKPRRLVEAMGMARLVEDKNNLARKPFTTNRNVSNPGILGPAPTT
nr:hypothetical protein [Tanacetum cinerariifolium]